MKVFFKFVLAVLMICLISGCFTVKHGINDFMISAERYRSGLKHGVVEIPGQKMAYLERPGSGETIVLIHAFTTNKDIWSGFVRNIPSEYRIIAFDMPGHGENSKDTAQTYSIEYMTKSLENAVDALKLGRFHIAGNSMGGWVSILYTARNAQRIMSMLLIDNAGIFSAPQPSDLQIAQSKGLNPLVPTTVEEFTAVLDYTFYKKPFLPWPVSAVLADEALEASSFYKKIKDDLDTHQVDLIPLLPTINTPVLVIWGDHDRIIHVSTTEILKRSLPESEIIIMKDCGHMPELERPEETAGYYVSFLKKNRK